MIGLFYPDAKTRLPITYPGITLNRTTDPDSPKSCYEVNSVLVAPQYDTTEDVHQGKDGSEVYAAYKTHLLVTIDGTLRATSYADFHDRVKALAAAFDPAKLTHEHPSAYLSYASLDGVQALDFSVPTADLANYPTGLVPSRYYARPVGFQAPIISEYTGLSSFFRLNLLVPDPRRYLQTPTTHAPGTIDNSLADYRSWPVITITMSGPGAVYPPYTLTRSGIAGVDDLALTLNFNGNLAGDVFTVYPETRTVLRTRAGVVTDQSWMLGGDVFEIEPLSQTLTVTNGTNASTSIAWYRAFCV